MTEPGLFAEPEHIAKPDAEAALLSADRRRTLRQRRDLDHGRHPLTRGLLHPDAAPVDDVSAPGRRCGNCRFRELLSSGNRSWPKCSNPRVGRISASAATDVRAWWPACRNHQPAKET